MRMFIGCQEHHSSAKREEVREEPEAFQREARYAITIIQMNHRLLLLGCRKIWVERLVELHGEDICRKIQSEKLSEKETSDLTFSLQRVSEYKINVHTIVLYLIGSLRSVDDI